MVKSPRRDEIWLVSLDPAVGSEIKKTRPCVVVSPDEMNEFLQTVLIAPLTSTIRTYPSRVDLVFQGKSGQVVLDQIRGVDRQRLARRLGVISAKAATAVSGKLVEMFSR